MMESEGKAVEAAKAGKILIFFPTIESGGIEKALAGIAAGLMEQGYEVILFYSSCQEKTRQGLPPGLGMYRAESPRATRFMNRKVWESLAVIPRLHKWIRKEKPDCILSFQSSALAIPVARLTRTPIIHRESSNCRAALAAQRKVLLRTAVRTGKVLTYRFCDAIVANSEASARALASLARLPGSKVGFIYNPLDAARIRSCAREEIGDGYDDGVPTVISVGRLSWEKNFALLISAFKLVREKMEARLVIIGEGSERPALVKLISELGLTGSVELPGYKPNPYPYVGRAAVFALSSLFEGLPNAMLEAVALGVPVVSVDCTSGPREILRDGEAGVLVPNGDAAALGRAILGILEDPARARALAEAATESARRFDPGHISAQYSGLVRAVCERRRPW